jgi:hypothetical protein
MTTVNPDIDALAAESTELTLLSGFPIKVNRIKTRALLSLMKILAHGVGDVLMQARFGPDTDPQEFAGQLLWAVVLSIPEAEDETIEFINRIVVPAQLKTGPRLSPGDRAWNEEQEEILKEELEDPEIDDLFTIVSEVIKNEADHVLALGKQILSLLPVAKATAKTEKLAEATSATARTRTSTARKKASASSKSASKE